MNRPLAMLAAGSLLVAACADDAPPEPSAGQAACDSALDRVFAAWADAGFSGSIAISVGGQTECRVAHGVANQAAGEPNTVDTVFNIGSITKSVTAASILQLAEMGKLSLDDRAGDLVPDLTGPVADATVEQLLLHTSGLTGVHGPDHQPLGRDEAVAAISRLELAFEPGSDFLYSNAGYSLLAVIIEQVSGTTYRDFTVERTLTLDGTLGDGTLGDGKLGDGGVVGGFWDGEPAAPGSRAVGYLDDGPTTQMGDFGGPHWAIDGNGALAMTPGDLAAWTYELFAGRLLRPGSVDVLTGRQFDQGDGTAETPGWVAYDDSLFGHPFFASAGGGGDVGHDVVVVWLPDREQVVVMASNTSDITAEQLLQAVGPALVAGDPLPLPDRDAPDADPGRLAAVVGSYEVQPGQSFDVTVDGDELIVSADGAEAVAALFAPSGRFTPDDVAVHEQLVIDLLGGATQEGQEERAILESELGAIDDVRLAGTIVEEGELRTYVTVWSGSESRLLWYALDDRGGIAAVEGPTPPPSLVLVPADGDTFRPLDPTGIGPDVTVGFDGDTMTITGASGTTTNATRAS